MRLRKGILARVSVPCVSRFIPFNRTFGSYNIIEGGLRKGTASSRSVQVPLSRGAWNVLLIINTNKQPWYKCFDHYVIKKSVPAMAAIYGTYTTDNVYVTRKAWICANPGLSCANPGSMVCGTNHGLAAQS